MFVHCTWVVFLPFELKLTRASEHQCSLTHWWLQVGPAAKTYAFYSLEHIKTWEFCHSVFRMSMVFAPKA